MIKSFKFEYIGAQMGKYMYYEAIWCAIWKASGQKYFFLQKHYLWLHCPFTAWPKHSNLDIGVLVYLHWKSSSLVCFFIYSQCYTMLESKNPPYILIVIRFNVNRFQCYSMLIQKNIATIFSRSLEFCSWKMWT